MEPDEIFMLAWHRKIWLLKGTKCGLRGSGEQIGSMSQRLHLKLHQMYVTIQTLTDSQRTIIDHGKLH